MALRAMFSHFFHTSRDGESIPTQSVSMYDNPSSEETLPDVQPKPPLMQLEVLSSHPVGGCLGEEANPYLATASFQGVIELQSPLSFLFSRLNSNNSLRHSSYDLLSVPFTCFIPLLWTCIMF